MAKYDIAVDRHQLLKAETLADAWTPFVSNAGKPLPEGLGWWITDYRGERLIWHYGHWGTGYSALYLKVPARHLTFIAMANSEALADHHYRVADNVTNDLFACHFIDSFIPQLKTAVSHVDSESPADVPTTGPAKDCELSSRKALQNWLADRRSKAHTIVALDPTLAVDYAGRYQLRPDRILVVTNEKGRLFINIPEGDRSEMYAISPTQFFVKSRPYVMTFVRDGGRVTRLDALVDTETVTAPRIK